MTQLRSLLGYLKRAFIVRSSRTVRYAFSLTALAALVLTAAVATSVDRSYVKVVPSTTTVEAGERFSIDVFAVAAEPVNAVNITLAFPSEQVEVLGVDIGQSVITLWTEDPYVDGERVVMSGGTYRRGFQGEHRIATINARAKATGLAQFSADDIRLLAGDGSGRPVATVADGGPVDLFVIDEDTDVATIAAELGLTILTDVDGDGEVTIRDVSVFMAAWAVGDARFDFNSDGAMTFVDFSILLADTFLK